jgi:glycine/D-amino acid oxidase-like deaminating enzyme
MKSDLKAQSRRSISHFVATGFSGHGFGIGPAAGRLAAELAIGDAPSVDPTPFRASRFSDGSPIMMGPEI